MLLCIAFYLYLYISFYIDRTQYIITTIIVYILCITFYINLQLHISFYYYVLRSLLNDICNHRYHILYSRIVVISPTHQLCPLTLLTLLTLLTNLRYSIYSRTPTNYQPTQVYVHYIGSPHKEEEYSCIHTHILHILRHSFILNDTERLLHNRHAG